MHKQDIEIVINAKGEVTYQVKGVKGGSCLGETKFLEEALGNQIKERQLTSDFYQNPVGTNTGVTSNN